MIQAVFVTVAVVSLLFFWWKCHRGRTITGIEAFRARMKIIFLALAACSLCSKAVVHTYKHFNPSPPPIIGP